MYSTVSHSAALDANRAPRAVLLAQIRPARRFQSRALLGAVHSVVAVFRRLEGAAARIFAARAAILSPTDAVSLSGIVGEGSIPKKLMDILQDEPLMNDASGLVSLQFTIVVTMGTMVFSVDGVLREFVKVAAGGLLAGVAVTPPTQTVLLLLLPLVAHLITEYIGVSGILGARVSG